MGPIIHYLDDFLAVFREPDLAEVEAYEQGFTETCQALGLEIKVSKNASGTVVEFLGLIIDTARMEARLPSEKKEKGPLLIANLASKKSCTLLDLQRVTGLLNFLSKLIPPGGTFCRRLYDPKLRFPLGCGNAGVQRIPSAARKDLMWW